jgi:hypothetical protein
MSFRQDSDPTAKWRERRRGVRMNSRVRIAVDYVADGQPVHAEAVTRIVSPYGCLVVLPHDLPIEHKLRVTNLDRGNAADGVVVWRGHERAEGRELGIELQSPEMDFWGLEL